MGCFGVVECQLYEKKRWSVYRRAAAESGSRRREVVALSEAIVARGKKSSIEASLYRRLTVRSNEPRPQNLETATKVRASPSIVVG